jgi:hypothetical protein
VVSPALTWLLDVPAVPAAGEAALAPSDVAALVAEGVLVGVADGVLPADTAAFPAARAAFLVQRLEAGDVVGGAAALWLRGRLDGLGVVDVVVPHGRTGGSRRDPAWRRTRSVLLPAHHVEVVGGVPVTTLERTATDIALWHPPQEAAPLLRQAVAAGADPALALDLLAVRRRPGQRAGRRQLRRLPGARRSPEQVASGLPAASDAVGVEDAVHAAHHVDDVPQVGGVSHLEGEARQGHPVA